MYQYGGEVIRVRVNSTSTEADMMTCSEFICEECWGNAIDLSVQSKSHGLPFIHKSNTIMKNFYPTSRFKNKVLPNEAISQNIPKDVRFQGLNGKVVCRARICEPDKCEVCLDRAKEGEFSRGIDDEES